MSHNPIKLVLLIIASCFIAVMTMLVAFVLLLDDLFKVPYPPQPVFGFKGNWRCTDVSGFVERPLPAASGVWQDYSSWRTNSSERRRLYLARLGGAGTQSAFMVSTNKGETPMGAQLYTNIEFFYTDPTNGLYHLHWSMRGAHDPGFLKFNQEYRLYQLEYVSATNDYPPKLYIVGIEGIRPEHYVER